MEKVAIIGMSGAFPKAKNISELWDMLCRKEEGIYEIDAASLMEAGVSQEEIENQNYVARGGYIAEAEYFDNDFFCMPASESLVTDPQQRLFLSHSWLALEDAGYEPGRIEVPVGVFAGDGATQYWFMLKNGAKAGAVDDFRLMVGNNKDFIATRTSYKLDLRGPSLNIQSGCSTGLAAVGLACQSLLTWGCDMAIAGAVTIGAPRNRGYTYVEGMISSRGGTCRPFDERADGAVFSEGVGVVCLKRLSQALEDGDYIYAVIDAVAMNNDGSDKVGFAAPSYKGQSEAIELAHALADVSPEDIGFIETHGTATLIGDPIEVQALRHAFRKSTIKEPYCWLGSIKANIGHTDAAAGIVSLIKTALVVNTGIIPPLMHFNTVNPQLELESSRFRINKEPVSWPLKNGSRIAGVSSFGVGGTNVHAIVESPPIALKPAISGEERFLLLSAKSWLSVVKQKKDIASYLRAHRGIPMSDLIKKYNRSRHDFRYRWGTPARDIEKLIAALDAESPASDSTMAENRVFVFPGQGSQFSGMAKGYHGVLPVFSEWIDKGLAHCEKMGLDKLRSYLLEDGHDDAIAETDITQPLLYIVEYALASELMSRGIQPTAVCGHSIGEYAAAAIAGVFSFEDGLSLVIKRGYWMQHAPSGAMIAVSAPLNRIEPYCSDGVYISVFNAGDQIVLSGSTESIAKVETMLETESIRFRRLKTRRAFHSPLMNDILDSFEQDLRSVSYSKATIPFISNLDGAWLPETVEWISYWRNQLRNPVHFDTCVATILELGSPVIFESGPGKVLSSLIAAQADTDVRTIQVRPVAGADGEYFDACLIKAWERGCSILWKRDRTAPQSLVLAPGYAFNAVKFWPENLTPAARNEEFARAPSVDEPVSEFPIGENVSRIWETTFGCRETNADSNFFDAGGDSLIAVQLLHAVRARFKVNISVSDFFRKPTLSALTDTVTSALGALEAAAEAVPGSQAIIPHRSDRTRAPLSSQQERLWFLHEMNPEKPQYNLVFTVKIETPCDTGRLQLALKRFFDRHDLFRAVVRCADGIPHLSFEEKADIRMDTLDFSDMDMHEAFDTFNAHVRELARTPMIFSQYPIASATIALFPGKTGYVCLLVPHIFSDGWSSSIFENELKDFYAHALDESWAPPALPIDFGDYAAWERNQRKTEAPAESAVRFWKEYLKGIPGTHDLPLDRPRPKESSGLGSSLAFTLDERVSAQIRKICDSQAMTPNMFFLACLAFLIWKYSKQETVVIGTPYANREQEEVRGLFGYFIRTIPLRFDVDETINMDAWLSYVKQQFLSAWEHSSLGIDELISLLAIPRMLNVNPIYQISFAFQSFGKRTGGEQHTAEQKSGQLSFDRGVSENDLALYMWETDRFQGTFEYATDIFDASSIEALAANFSRVASVIAKGFGGRLDRVELMDAKGRELVDRTNRTEVPEHLGHNFLELFAASLKSFSDAPAVISGNTMLTYGELDSLSSRISRRLVAAGAHTEGYIGIYMNRDRWLLPSLLAVFKAGCAYVPLDPDFPTERLAGIVSEAGIQIIVTVASLDSVASTLGAGIRTLCADADLDAPGVLLPAVGPDMTAYVLFTSGSTGKPKGVPIRQDALTNYLLSMRTAPGMTGSDKALALTTFSFDISTLELFLPLTCGAHVVILDNETTKDAEAIVRSIDRDAVTIVFATPSRWSLLLETGWRGHPDMQFLTGGEALPLALANALVETGAEVWNMYGPTEATVCSSLCKIARSDKAPDIGTPVANTKYFVLDQYGRPLPAGIPGELGISGAGLSSGYLNRPDLTDERFIEIKYGGEGIRIYKTGDLVQQDLSGNFKYLGRNDFQVKIRGFRIELGEIESMMLLYPGILEAVCTVWVRSEKDKRIVAYYRSEVAIDESGLKAHLKKSLPEYMIPGHFMTVAVFPRSSSGKTDRKALPLPSVTDLPSTGKTPVTVMQEQMLEVWSDVLGHEVHAIDENFFDLGGHSLLAVELIHKLNERFNGTWKIRNLFETPTVEGLAESWNATKLSRIPLLFAVTRKGSGSPLFLVPGVYKNPYYMDENNSMYEQDFLRYFSNILFIMGNERPIYGLRPRGIYKGETFHKTIDLMAQEYIEEIKKVQPRGPYLIGGECLGGQVAYAIACRLVETGNTVSTLLLLDTFRISLKDEIMLRLNDTYNDTKKSVKAIFNIVQHHDADLDPEVMQDLLIRYFPLTKGMKERRRFESGPERYTKILRHYRPKRYEGKVLLIVNEVWNSRNALLGWDTTICPGLDFHIVPGDHLTRLNIYSGELERCLRENLD